MYFCWVKSVYTEFIRLSQNIFFTLAFTEYFCERKWLKDFCNSLYSYTFNNETLWGLAFCGLDQRAFGGSKSFSKFEPTGWKLTLKIAPESSNTSPGKIKNFMPALSQRLDFHEVTAFSAIRRGEISRSFKFFPWTFILQQSQNRRLLEICEL